MNNIEKIGGPAIVKIGTKLIFTKDDITVTPEITFTENETSIHGKTSSHFNTVQHNIEVTPAAMVTADALQLLFQAYANLQLGSRLYSPTSDSVIIWTQAGMQHEYKMGALTSLCGLNFSTTSQLFDGSVTYTAIGDVSEPISTPDHYVAIAAEAFTAAAYDETKEFQLAYNAAWGAAPFDSIESQAGFKFAFDLQTEDDISDRYGIYNKTVTGFGVTGTFSPIGISEAQILTAMGIQGTGAVRGRRLGAMARDLTLTTGVEGDPYFKLFNCALTQAPSMHGRTANNMGDLQLVAQRKFTAGVVQPLFEIGLTAA